MSLEDIPHIPKEPFTNYLRQIGYRTAMDLANARPKDLIKRYRDGGFRGMGMKTASRIIHHTRIHVHPDGRILCKHCNLLIMNKNQLYCSKRCWFNDSKFILMLANVYKRIRHLKLRILMIPWNYRARKAKKYLGGKCSECGSSEFHFFIYDNLDD